MGTICLDFRSLSVPPSRICIDEIAFWRLAVVIYILLRVEALCRGLEWMNTLIINENYGLFPVITYSAPSYDWFWNMVEAQIGIGLGLLLLLEASCSLWKFTFILTIAHQFDYVPLCSLHKMQHENDSEKMIILLTFLAMTSSSESFYTSLYLTGEKICWWMLYLYRVITLVRHKKFPIT